MNKIEKTKKILINATLILVSIVICIVIVDRLVPFFVTEKYQLRNKRFIYLKEHVANYDLPLSCPVVVCDDGTTRLRTDRDGFILGPEQNAADTGSVDILFLGGSTTETFWVNEDKRFPYLISQLLQKTDNQKITTLNGAVSGGHVMHSTLSLLTKGLARKPKMVVIMHNVNDLTQLLKSTNYNYDGIVGDNKLIKIKSPFRSFVSLLKSLKNILVPNIYFHGVYSTGLRDSIANYFIHAKQYPQLSDDIKNAVKSSFTKSLRMFVAICRAQNIEPVLMTQMNRLFIDDDLVRAFYEEMRKNPYSFVDYVAVYHEMNQIVRDVALTENVLLIDLDRELSGNKDYIYDPVHLTNEGSVVAANIIAQELATAFPDMFRLSQS